MSTGTGKLKGKSLAARTSQIQAEMPKVGAGHSKADQAAHIEQWLEGKKESGHGFPAAGGSKEKHVAGKIPPQFLKKDSSDESAKADLRGKGKKKKAGRAAAVAKRLGGKAKKGSLPPWLAKKD